jgi:hypothetical protein
MLGFTQTSCDDFNILGRAQQNIILKFFNFRLTEPTHRYKFELNNV